MGEKSMKRSRGILHSAAAYGRDTARVLRWECRRPLRSGFEVPSRQRPPISDGAGFPTPQVTNPAEWAIAAIVGGRKVQRWGNVGKIRMFNQHHATIVSN